MEQIGEYKPYLVSWVDDKLGCSRIVMAHQWTKTPVREVPIPPISIPHIRTEHNPDEGGGSGISTFYFEGTDGPPRDRVSYEFQGSFNQEPIASHPKIGELLKKYRGRLEDGEIVWDPKDPTGKSTRGGWSQQGNKIESVNPMYGVQAYLAIGAVWTVNRLYEASNIPSSILRGIGTIYKNPPGNPPTPPGRNWLKMSPTGRTRGNVLEISDNYLLSGIGGWLEPVYDGSDIEGEAN